MSVLRYLLHCMGNCPIDLYFVLLHDIHVYVSYLWHVSWTKPFTMGDVNLYSFYYTFYKQTLWTKREREREHASRVRYIIYRCFVINIKIKRCSSVQFTAPYSFDKDTLFAILEKEKEKVTAKLEEFAQLLRDSKVGKTCAYCTEVLCRVCTPVNSSVFKATLLRSPLK